MKVAIICDTHFGAIGDDGVFLQDMKCRLLDLDVKTDPLLNLMQFKRYVYLVFRLFTIKVFLDISKKSRTRFVYSIKRSIKVRKTWIQTSFLFVFEISF